MVTTAPAPISFVLPGRDRLRWKWLYLWHTQSGRSTAAALMMLALTGNYVLHPVHDPTASAIVRYGYVVVAFIAVVRAIGALRTLKRTERMSLAFTDKEIDLRSDGNAERISWYGIKGALAFEGFYAIERRADARHPILIPSAAVADADAFWSYLELRMQGAVPYVRELGVPAPKRLTNRAGQYLIDDLTNGATP